MSKKGGGPTGSVKPQRVSATKGTGGVRDSRVSTTHGVQTKHEYQPYVSCQRLRGVNDIWDEKYIRGVNDTGNPTAEDVSTTQEVSTTNKVPTTRGCKQNTGYQ